MKKYYFTKIILMVMLALMAAMILGGMGSIKGAILGGVLIGLVEILSTYMLGADYVNITVYGLLLLLLVFRPQGIFGRPMGREKL